MAADPSSIICFSINTPGSGPVHVQTFTIMFNAMKRDGITKKEDVERLLTELNRIKKIHGDVPGLDNLVKEMESFKNKVPSESSRVDKAAALAELFSDPGVEILGARVSRSESKQKR